MPLSPEQLALIEKNKRDAIERRKDFLCSQQSLNNSLNSSSTLNTNTHERQPQQSQQQPQQQPKILQLHKQPLSTHLKQKVKLKTHSNNQIPIITLQLYSDTHFSIPHHISLLSLLKDFPSSSYREQKGIWCIPLEFYSECLAKLKRRHDIPPCNIKPIPPTLLALFMDRFTPKIDFSLALNSCSSSSDPTTIPPTLLEALFPFQREGVEESIRRGGKILIADEMGLGKSIQSLAIAHHYKSEWPLLIICPSSLIGTWALQVKRWYPSTLTAEDGSLNCLFDSKNHLKSQLPPTFPITILSFNLAIRLLPKRPKHFPAFSVVIVDECHALKNPQSKRCLTILPVLKEARRTILLSGTPALSRPMELFSVIQSINPGPFPSTPFSYGMRYCNGYKGRFGYDFSGSSCLGELDLCLKRWILIRRTKDQVLDQLPPKIRHQIFLSIPPSVIVKHNQKSESLKEDEEDAFSFMDQWSAGFGSGGTNNNNNNNNNNINNINSSEASYLKRVEGLAMWRKTAETKLPYIIEYCNDLIENGHKILVFCHHQCILDGVEEGLAGRKIRIDGRTPTKDREGLCALFQGDKEIRSAVLSITAASTGLTLTAATTVVFGEMFWNPGILLQAEDRAHRIGQRDSVNVHYLLAKGTSDDRIWPIITRKLALLEKVGLSKDEFSTLKPQRLLSSGQKKIDSYLL